MTDSDPPVDRPGDEHPLPVAHQDPRGPAVGGPSRTALVLSAGVSAVVLGLALAAPGIANLAGIEEEPPDLSAVRVHEVTDTRHSTDDIDYPQTPPVGGPHAPAWLDCGHYEEPVREENVVHDLEHGTVWITYDPDLSPLAVGKLLEQLPANGILSPHEDLPSPVVVTVWSVQLSLDGADDERLPLFLAEYGDGHTAPEFGASCEGGTPYPDGEVPEPGLGT